MENQVRCFADIVAESFNYEKNNTETSFDQVRSDQIIESKMFCQVSLSAFLFRLRLSQ